MSVGSYPDNPGSFESRINMAELVRTNDPGLLSVIESSLADAHIRHHVADRDMSVMEGSHPRHPAKGSGAG